MAPGAAPRRSLQTNRKVSLNSGELGWVLTHGSSDRRCVCFLLHFSLRQEGTEWRGGGRAREWAREGGREGGNVKQRERKRPRGREREGEKPALPSAMSGM